MLKKNELGCESRLLDHNLSVEKWRIEQLGLSLRCARMLGVVEEENQASGAQRPPGDTEPVASGAEWKKNDVRHFEKTRSRDRISVQSFEYVSALGVG